MFFKSKPSNSSKAAAEAASSGTPASEAAARPEASSDSAPPAQPSQTASRIATETTEPEQDRRVTEQQSSLSEEELQKRAVMAKHTSASFGDIVRLLMHSNEFKNLKLADLDGLVVPAVATGQFLTAEAQLKTNGVKQPVATVLWASVSEDVDQRFSDDLDRPVNLEAKEWKSGEIPWLIAAAGDRRLIADMLKRIQKDVFNGRPIKLRTRDPNGQTVVTTVDALQRSRN